ncbi:MAG TPA: YhdH/YhfP family quinone oxidoreductase [Lentimicrobium sp.]|nr:YhdH/YhfP family quinone oxidoreductase [Lentimicrobium sp.]
MNRSIKYTAIVAEETGNEIRPVVKTLDTTGLPPGDVFIRVLFSSLNYKDALSATGNKGITKKYPHTPGIDACGTVIVSNSSDFKEGDTVIVHGHDLGMNTSGGFGQYIKVPSDWVFLLPEGLSPAESMALGTAGYTAALAIHQMELNGQDPSHGPVLVTGATGGLASLAINILKKKGYRVIASTGKKEESQYLHEIGATEIVSRAEVNDESGKHLLRPRWAGAIDTVGGNILVTALKACQKHGNVVATGNANSWEMHGTVFPFILNGVNLLGVDSATSGKALRLKLWNHLATGWKPEALPQISNIIPLESLPERIDLMLQGKVRGRTVVDMNAE